MKNGFSFYNGLQILLQIVILLAILFAQLGLIPFLCVVFAITCAQVVAVYEIINAVLARTSSRPLTTLMQVGARIGIALALFASLNLEPVWIISLLGASWAIADLVRYLYYLKKDVFAFAWARYQLFIVLYPLGMTLENIVVYKLIAAAASEPLVYFIPFVSVYAVLAAVMYQHMLKQRKRFLGSLAN